MFAIYCILLKLSLSHIEHIKQCPFRMGHLAESSQRRMERCGASIGRLADTQLDDADHAHLIFIS